MLINPALLAALQGQLVAAAVTDTLLLPPDAPKPALVGLRVKLQVGPVWVTVWVCPAMVSVPVSSVVRSVADTARLLEPSHTSKDAEVMVIKPSLLTALQGQLVAAAVTDTLLLPPDAPKPALV